MTGMIGKVYGIPPQPPVPGHTRRLPAGAVTFGVEYRDLDPASLVETYKDNPAHLAEMLEKSPEGGFADEGVSIHVWGTEDGHEYLRFDVFAGDPHYHYVHSGAETINNVIDFDTTAHGEMLPWVMHTLRTRLGEMLTQAGGEDVAVAVDRDAVWPVLDEVEQMAVAAQVGQQAARSSS
jgi:hypothetical protein